MTDAQGAEEIVDDLIQEMTLVEKVSQLGTVRLSTLLEDGEFSRAKATSELENGIGRVTRVGRESDLGPSEIAEVTNELQTFLVNETRLGVPALLREESLCGYAGKGGSMFPQSIGMASSWKPSLVERVAETIRYQLESVGIGITLSPVADMAHDFRWGRTEETYGENPYLVAKMATAYVTGLQGPNFDGVLATIKHFAGHGGSRGGRNRSSVNRSSRYLRENDLFPFETAIDVGDAASVMAAYHDIDGIPCHASYELLTGLLRNEWEFDGTVISDGRGIEMLVSDHRVAPDKQAAGIMAMNAGVDIEVPETECYGDKLVAAVETGQVDEQRVDEAVRRHLREKMRSGLFSGQVVDTAEIEDAFETDTQRALAREAACQSIVLLQNRNDTLPLDEDVGHLAVVGPNADTPRNLLGNYAYGANDEKDNPIDVVSPLEGISAAVSDETEVNYVKGCPVMGEKNVNVTDAVEAARGADVAIVCVGGKSGINVEHDSSGTSGEALDRTDLRLPGEQEKLVRAVHATETPIVVVLVNGRPLSIGRTAERVPAIVETWLPGEEGGNAIADVLFGATNPGGKLPVSLPRSVGQQPITPFQTSIDNKHEYVFTDSDPLYPFGHGKSYTTFEYETLDIHPTMVDSEEKVTISVDVVNTGQQAGDEVVQFYARDIIASRVRPSQSLVGFKRVSLKPGERATVKCKLSTDQIAFYDRKERLVIEPGDVKISVGASSGDIRLSGTFEIRGEIREVTDRQYFSDVTVKTS